MPYKEPDTITELTDGLGNLRDQLAVMIQSLGSNHVMKDGNLQDVRIITLKECKHHISTTIALLNALYASEKGFMTEARWLQVFGIDTKDTPLPAIKTQIIQYLKLSLVTMYQFRIENMMTTILFRLDSGKLKKGYHGNAQTLLSVLQLKDQKTKLDKLSVLAFIRNSLHSGGIVNRYGLDVIIDGYRFNFKKGEKLKQAGWGHIFLAMGSSLIIINEILHSKDVEDIPEPISALFIEPDLEKNHDPTGNRLSVTR